MPPKRSHKAEIPQDDGKIEIRLHVYLPRFNLTYVADSELYDIAECETLIEKTKDSAEAMVLCVDSDTVVIPHELVREAIIKFEGLTSRRAHPAVIKFEDDL